jgi:uncharacterized phage protein (TIGR01671 family)
MKDTLRCRAWDRQNKKMHYNDFAITSTGYIAKLESIFEPDPEDDGEGKLIENQFFIDQQNMEYDESLVVIQCTGKKDYDGTLIFNSDIVSYFRKGKPLKGYVSYCTKEMKFKIFEYLGCDWAGTAEFKELSYNELKFNKLKVIGNVHEHKHLLEA